MQTPHGNIRSVWILFSVVLFSSWITGCGTTATNVTAPHDPESSASMAGQQHAPTNNMGQSNTPGTYNYLGYPNFYRGDLLPSPNAGGQQPSNNLNLLNEGTTKGDVRRDFVVVSPKLQGAFLSQGRLSLTDTDNDGNTTSYFIAGLPSDVSVEHVPDQLMVFADHRENAQALRFAQAEHARKKDDPGSEWDSQVLSPEPTRAVNGNIYFAFNSWDIPDSMVQPLVASAKWLQSNRDAKITVEGHCDARGSREYNVVLGERRATAVRSFLRDLGVGEEQIVTISYGKERPTCLDGSESCYAQNRRAYVNTL